MQARNVWMTNVALQRQNHKASKALWSAKDVALLAEKSIRDSTVDLGLAGGVVVAVLS